MSIILRGGFTAFLLPFAFCLLPFDFLVAPQQNAQSQIEAGRKLFAGSCSNSYCHGSAGTGGGGPKLKDREFTADYLSQVIAGGIPGTSMPGFKDRYNQEQLEQIVTYVLSLSPNNPKAKAGDIQRSASTDSHLSPTTPKPEPEKSPAGAPAAANDSGDLRGDALAGRELFFDSAIIQNCRVCHTVQGIGGKIGPDLSNIATKPAREILQSIVSPSSFIEERYSMISLTTKSGSHFAGVKRDENMAMIRLYDTSTLPPVSRFFLKSEVEKIEKLNISAMPGDYGTKYSLKQLLDLVSFLKSADMSKPMSVGVKEVF